MHNDLFVAVDKLKLQANREMPEQAATAVHTPKQATPACSLAGLDNDVLKLIGERVVVEWGSSGDHEG